MTSRDERITKLSNEGWTTPELAREFGLSTRQIGRIRSRLGLKQRSNFPQEVRDRIRYLSEVEGWPPSEIAREVGVSYNTVHTYCVKGVGLEWRDTARDLQAKYPRLWAELKRAV